MGSHILHPLTCSVPGSSARETAGASRTLNSGQHVRQLFAKPELPIKVGKKKVIPVCEKILNMWSSFFHKTESLLDLQLVYSFPYVNFECSPLWIFLVSQMNVMPFSHLTFPLLLVAEQCLRLKSTFINEILKL